MSNDTWFDAEKALEVLLYVAHRVPNMYNALKVLYLADRMHLERYGRLICGESYVRMAWGPVPSGAYDIVKSAGNRPHFDVGVDPHGALKLDGHCLTALRQHNPEYFSESDIECLDEAIVDYGGRAFGDLHQVSADSAYDKAEINGPILLEDIIRSLPNGDLIREYLDCS